MGDVISGVGLGLFGRGHRARAQTARANFLTRVFIGNQSFEPLTGFLAFLVETLWPKSHNFGKKQILVFYLNF